MLFSEKMNAAINEQIGREFAASLEYVSIASSFASEGLTELAKHFYRQAEEERDHAMRFVKYVVDAGGRIAIPAIPAPKSAFASAEEAVRNSLEWEVTVTKHIKRISGSGDSRDRSHDPELPPVVCHRAAGRSVQHGDAAECRAACW